MILLRVGFFLLFMFGTANLQSAWCAPTALSDQELTEVSGQGFVTLSNANLNGLDFSTITLNANVMLNANLHNILLGQYGSTANGGADINIPQFQFGTSAGTTAQQTVQIINPYIEFVYNNTSGAGQSQVVGMRIGFEGIAGNVGLLMNTVSGSLQIDNGAGGLLTSNGYRSTTACAGTSCMPLSQIGGVVAGNANGPSRDLWISMLSQAVQFPAQSGLTQPTMAQPGMWLNWTDRVAAANTTGMVLANLLAQVHR
ncbi:hypothetical protein AAKU67_000365 [Oxalobacteraceae bacterium GrIS 2.11]